MNKADLTWDEGALKKMEKIPVFVRKMAKGKIEKAAMELGEHTITEEFIEKVRSQTMG